MKKFYKFLTLILGFCFIFTILNKPISVQADMGPKPAVDITLKNLDQECYITLLSKHENNGPYRAYTDGENPLEGKEYYSSEIPDDIYLKFINYHDNDNYYFLQVISKLTPGNNNFRWGYYPPEPFKILIYFEETDTFITSGIMERYAFKSYYEIDMNKNLVDGSLDIFELNGLSRNYNYIGEILSLLVRIVLTIAIELLIALLFMIKSKKLFVKVAIVNVVTQVILNIILNINYFNNGALSYMLLYIPLELLVIIIEAIAFTIIFRKQEELKYPTLIAISYAVIANLLSYGLGMILALYFPFAF